MKTSCDIPMFYNWTQTLLL